MKNFLKFLILPAAFVATLTGFTPSASAAVDPLVVVFAPNPLFVQANFLPLDQTSGTVTVTNNTDTTQTVITEAINVLDNDNFGSLLRLKIVGSGTLFDNSLANFFSTAGEVSLGTIASGASKTFTYTVSFINSSNNSYQEKTLGFDVCVGFQGGTARCGNTIVGGEGNTGGGGTGGGGGGIISGTGGGGGIGLAIYNEQATGINPVGGSAVITWNTNLFATSQVIYGLASGGPYALVLVPPNFGYPLYTAEGPTKIRNHSVTLTGLTPGQTYVYRVVSRASPPTVSAEHQFILAFASPPQTVPDVVGGGVVGVVGTLGDGAVGGAGGGGTSTTAGGASGTGTVADTSSEETASETPNLQLASALSGLPSGFLEFFQSFYCWLAPLLMLLGIFIAWILIDRWRGYEEMMSPYEYRRKQILFLVGGILLMLAYALIFRNQCIITPLLIILAVLIAWLVWHHYSNRQK